MIKTITTLLFAITFICFSNAQEVSTRLATITEGDAFNSAGLGVTFRGEVMSDGNLYFQGSSNGFRESIWKTDGTVSGTARVLREADEFGGDWSQKLFIDQGVIVNIDQNWNILRPGSDILEALDNLPGDRFQSIDKVSDGSYYITVERDDNIILFTCSADFSDVNEVGIVHPDVSFLLLTAGDAGAIILSTNTFTDDAPLVYLKETNSTQPLEDYIGSLSLSIDISTLTYAYIHGRYMFLSFRDEDGFFQDKIVDMISMTSNDFEYISEPLEYYEFEDQLIIVTKREVVSLNTIDMSSKELYGNVFSFTPVEKIGDKIYFLTRENGMENLVEVNLSDESSKSLVGAETGNSFYNSKIESYKDELYYIGESDYQILYKYDFEAESPVMIDTLSLRTGATVVHALIEVNDELVISKRFDFVQHEMFVIGDGSPSSLRALDAKELLVSPTLASDFISIEMESLIGNTEALIFNMNGQLVSKLDILNGQLDVSALMSSKYYGFVEQENKLYRFQFVKM